MAVSVVMPALEMAQETGKLVSWKKKEGEKVVKGEMLLEVETDKAVVEVEAQADGVLGGVTAKTGDVVPVGQTIAWLLQPGEKPPAASAAPAQTGRKMDAAPAASASQAVAASAPAQPGPAQISPKARRLAKEHGVDVTRLRGSGPGGEIVAEDVLTAAQSGIAAPAPAAAPSPSTVSAPRVVSAGGSETLSSIGRLMAERTTQSWTTVPHFFVTREVDGSALVAVREKLGPAVERDKGVKLTYTDLLTTLVARVLKQHPRMNASWIDNNIRANAEVKVGLAMAVNDGVVVGVITRAEAGDLGAIAIQRRGITERARAGKLMPTDITGATFTISNLGMYHVDQFTAIIVPPQAGILAVGAMTDRVVPMPGALIPVGIKPMLTLTLSCDHRVVDGARGAAFLHDVVEAIRDAEKHLG